MLMNFNYFITFLLFIIVVNCINDNNFVTTSTTQIINTITNNEQLLLNSNIPFIESDSIINATLGKYIELTCIVHNLKNYKIAWYHDGILLTLDTIRIYDDDRYSIENKKLNEWKLIINQVDLNDDGQYTCRLSNGLKKIINLKIGVPPKFTSNDSTHQVYLNVNEYENLTLSCEAYGNPMPVIYWYRKNKHISTGIHLHIKNLTRHNHFEYECVARNNVPPDASRHFKININFEPTINLMYHFQTYLNVQPMTTNSLMTISSDSGDDFNEDYNLIKDDRNSIRNLEFVCEIYGNPVYSISWIKDGIKLKEITNYVNFNYINKYDKIKSKILSITTNQIKSHKYLTRLQIKNVDENDNGIYSCLIYTINGNISKTLTVDDIKPTILGSKDSLVIHKNNNRKYHKQKITYKSTKSTKTTTTSETMNNIIELNIDEENYQPENHHKKKLLFNIQHHKKIQQHENSIESNAFVGNRGARSNTTILEKNGFYYSYNIENKSNKIINNNKLYSLLLLLLILIIYVI